VEDPVNLVINHRVPNNAGNFLTKIETMEYPDAEVRSRGTVQRRKVFPLSRPDRIRIRHCLRN